MVNHSSGPMTVNSKATPHQSTICFVDMLAVWREIETIAAAASAKSTSGKTA